MISIEYSRAPLRKASREERVGPNQFEADFPEPVCAAL